jgi:hypothetical protein
VRDRGAQLPRLLRCRRREPARTERQAVSGRAQRLRARVHEARPAKRIAHQGGDGETVQQPLQAMVPAVDGIHARLDFERHGDVRQHQLERGGFRRVIAAGALRAADVDRSGELIRPTQDGTDRMEAAHRPHELVVEIAAREVAVGNERAARQGRVQRERAVDRGGPAHRIRRQEPRFVLPLDPDARGERHGAGAKVMHGEDHVMPGKGVAHLFQHRTPVVARQGRCIQPVDRAQQSRFTAHPTHPPSNGRSGRPGSACR